jgi:iron(III) transport system ATP-binding protein
MITVQELVKDFGVVRAVDHVTLEMQVADPLAIYGPSGSGKTTFLRLIAGLDMPDEGTVRINGDLMSGEGILVAPHERGVGFVFQSPALWPHMTVAKNILFGLKGLPKQEAQERLGELLERTELQGLETRYPSQLSGGQARRVALARTLAPKPKILLMDEPLTNVDPALKASLLELVKEVVSQESITMIYVTHDMEEAAQIAGDRLIEMKMGQLMDPAR